MEWEAELADSDESSAETSGVPIAAAASLPAMVTVRRKPSKAARTGAGEAASSRGTGEATPSVNQKKAQKGKVDNKVMQKKEIYIYNYNLKLPRVSIRMWCSIVTCFSDVQHATNICL